MSTRLDERNATRRADGSGGSGGGSGGSGGGSGGSGGGGVQQLDSSHANR